MTVADARTKPVGVGLIGPAGSAPSTARPWPAVAATLAAGVPLQVGFNRRFDTGFRGAHELVAAGRLGTPQLLRSLTRDPGIPDPGRVPPSTIFDATSTCSTTPAPPWPSPWPPSPRSTPASRSDPTRSSSPDRISIGVCTWDGT